MKKKPFDTNRLQDEKLDSKKDLEVNQKLEENTVHEFAHELSYEMDKESNEVIENTLKSAYAEEKKNLHLTEEFRRSLIVQMKQVAAEESFNNTVNNGVAIEKSAKRTTIEDADTEGEKIKTETSSNGVIHSIRHFLNREIEIPLVPVLAASLLLIAINVMPLNYEPRPEGRIIEVGGSQLWIPYNGEGEDVAYEN